MFANDLEEDGEHKQRYNEVQDAVMKLLFSSDLHGDMAAYESFGALLRDHSCGVLAGDLLDEIIPLTDAVRFGLVAADEPEELHGEDWDEVAAFEARYRDAISNPKSVNRRGLDIKRRHVAEVLSQAGKPIYFVTGNHDIGRWPDHCLMRNIRGKKVHLNGHSIVGLTERFNGIRSTLRPSFGFTRRIDGRTILVSHVPPFGVLDKTELRGADGRVVRAQHIGNVALRRITDRRRPMYCLFGHVHEGFGCAGNMINGSWYLAHQFLSIDLDRSEVSIISPHDGVEAPEEARTSRRTK